MMCVGMYQLSTHTKVVPFWCLVVVGDAGCYEVCRFWTAEVEGRFQPQGRFGGVGGGMMDFDVFVAREFFCFLAFVSVE